MPELPEVETIARRLREPLVGRRAGALALLWGRSLATPTPAELSAGLPGQRLLEVSRRGKFILLSFERHTLLAHLRMSGDLRVAALAEPIQPHDRFWLNFEGADDTLRLVFNDARKFGRLWLVEDPAEVTGGLGPEPLDPGFTPEVLSQRLLTTRRALKPLLLDQSFLAGLGNIYTDEALHMARLHPLTPANKLSDPQVDALWRAIRAVLEEGIRRNGASIDWVYRGGDFQNHFRAYQRTGEACPVCGTPIARMVVGQRGTHFCPTCQQIF